MLKKFDSLFELFEAFPDEQAAIDHFRAIRWRDGEFCPYCGSTRIYHFSDKTLKCRDCRERFSIKVGTIFEDTKLPLRKWFMAIWLITYHPKGIASTTLAKDLKITQKTAWFVLHRLRHAARTNSFNAPLKGEWKLTRPFSAARIRTSMPPNAARTSKVVVIGMLERGGQLRTKKLDTLKQAKGEIKLNVEPGSNLMTDEWPGYKGLEKTYHHHTVNHSAGEYVKHYFCHVNGIEGAWGLFKRQIYGIHHWVSEKHLSRYLDEMTWRYNRRMLEEGDRVNHFLGSVSGRLTYKMLIS